MAPEIHPRLLEMEPDVTQLIEGLRWARRVLATPPFARHVRNPIEANDGAGNGEMEDLIRRTAEPLYHAAGSCRMGSDAQAVVDPDLRVNNIGGLWVADLSIFPRHIGGNTHATALMIGERAADLIAGSLR